MMHGWITAGVLAESGHIATPEMALMRGFSLARAFAHLTTQTPAAADLAPANGIATIAPKKAA